MLITLKLDNKFSINIFKCIGNWELKIDLDGAYHSISLVEIAIDHQDRNVWKFIQNTGMLPMRIIT